MTTGPAHGERSNGGARAWARFTEPHFQPLYQTVFERLGVKDGTRLLDVGCGPGGAAILAAERGARVAGLDASSDSIEVAQERLPDGDFRVGDMQTLPWPDGSFEIVTGFNSFQFAAKPARAFTEVRRVLSARGKVGIVVWAPPNESQQPGIMAAISALAPAQSPGAPGPFALSASGKVESVLEEAGLRLVDRGEIPVVLESPDAEAACKGMMAGSGGMRAIQHVGEERVRQVILERLEEFRAGEGYRFVNRFRFVIAE